MTCACAFNINFGLNRFQYKLGVQLCTDKHLCLEYFHKNHQVKSTAQRSVRCRFSRLLR